MGSSLLVWAGIIHLLLAIGVAAVWTAPTMVPVDATMVSVVCAAMAIGVVGVALERVFSFQSNMLHGTNLRPHPDL